MALKIWLKSKEASHGGVAFIRYSPSSNGGYGQFLQRLNSAFFQRFLIIDSSRLDLVSGVNMVFLYGLLSPSGDDIFHTELQFKSS